MASIRIDEAALAQSLNGVQVQIRNASRDALAETCSEITEMAKTLAPVRTGTLRNSINFQVEGMTGMVSADAPYSGYVENGTRYMAARPFMRPAFNAVVRKMPSKIAGGMN